MKRAEVRLICSGCGGPLTPGDTACPSCSAVLVYPEGLNLSQVQCPVCGYRNRSGGEFCESCGARLLVKGSVSEKSKGKGRSESKAPPAKKVGRRREPWMVVAGLSVVILLAAIIYMNWQQGRSGSTIQSTQAAAASPAGPSMTDLAAREQAVLANPNEPALLLALANGLHDNRDWGRAISTYEKYLEKVPGNPDARVDMGICYFELAQQDPAKAGEYYGKAVSLMRAALEGHPDHQPAAFNLGIVNLQMGNIEESNKWLKRAVDLGKSTPLGQRAQHMLEEHTFSK